MKTINHQCIFFNTVNLKNLQQNQSHQQLKLSPKIIKFHGRSTAAQNRLRYVSTLKNIGYTSTLLLFTCINGCIHTQLHHDIKLAKHASTTSGCNNALVRFCSKFRFRAAQHRIGTTFVSGSSKFDDETILLLDFLSSLEQLVQ